MGRTTRSGTEPKPSARAVASSIGASAVLASHGVGGAMLPKSDVSPPAFSQSGHTGPIVEEPDPAGESHAGASDDTARSAIRENPAQRRFMNLKMPFELGA